MNEANGHVKIPIKSLQD